MAIKKSELYSSLWQSCDELRGGMDASQYKDYVLVLLFLKYISDKYAGKKFAPITIPAGSSFADMAALKGKPTIGDDINKKIIGPLAKANPQLSQADFADFNDNNKLGSGKEMVDRLTNLISIFENPALDFSKNRADGDDLLGDAYEYLMRHFATESGKSKGQFLTPSEVSLVMSLILGLDKADLKSDTTAYDPTCGSGSLLLKLAHTAYHAKGVNITLYGQEKDSSTAGLARMNMILHNCATAEIEQGNTLADPHFLDGDSLKTFDYAAANPPFSDKRWSTGLDPEHDTFQRFTGYGVPPDKQGDYAYLLHIIRSLKSTGKGACILPHGVLFRGNAEGVIRKNLIQRGIIKGIIGLPANLFYGTGIPACIILIDKEHAQARKGVFMIDASKGFRKDGPKNRLREQDIHRIVDTFNRQQEIPGYSRMVPVTEIADAKNDYNLNLPRYIDSTETEDIQDIAAHLHGGIPDRDLDALHAYWKVIPGVRAELFSKVVEEIPTLPKGMSHFYGETHFCTPDHIEKWPSEFAIITAYATTGEKWTDQQNQDADAELMALLQKKLLEIHRITGYSPNTGHSEPGWIAPLSFKEACDIAHRFKQDAIYFVQDGNLNVSYCDERRKLIPIGAFLPRLHLSNGKPLVRPDYSALRIPASNIKSTIFGHAEFTAFNETATKLFNRWEMSVTPTLKEIKADTQPKEVIQNISEDLLETFHKASLVDAYDVYQHLMDYWSESMQDDCYLIVGDGWKMAAQPQLIIEDKTKKSKTKPDFSIGKKKYAAELIPPALVISRYYPKDQTAIDTIEAELAALEQELEEMAEEHGGEDGLLAEAKNDKEKITKASAAARLKDIKKDPDAVDERKVLEAYLKLTDKAADLGTKLKTAQEALTAKVAAKYGELTEDEIKTLVVNDKWLATIAAAVQGELDRVSQTLTGRIRLLADRYAAPLPQIVYEVEQHAAKVAAHLEKMGVKA